MSSIVTFGEIMGRLTPPGFLRLRQALPGTLEVTFAGAEANVAASLSMFGADAKFVTALPGNDLRERRQCLPSVCPIPTQRCNSIEIPRNQNTLGGEVEEAE